MNKEIFCFLNVSSGEFLIIIFALIIILGPKKIPVIAKTIGKILAQSRQIISKIQNEIEIDKDSFDIEPVIDESNKDVPNTDKSNNNSSEETINKSDDL
jgi:Sec-independent protein translocase protein TatA